jgi:hypothetical protein
MMDKDAMLDLIRKTVAKRNAGVTIFDYRVRTDSLNIEPPSLLDAYTQALNPEHDHVGDQWRLVDRDSASSIISNLLNQDMAYHNQVMPFAEAQQCARLIVGLFNNDARFFTNGDWSGDSTRRFQQWMPLTHHTFDSGIIACDSQHIGCFWAADED